MIDKLGDAVKYSFGKRRRILTTTVFSAFFYVLTILLTFPAYSFQLLSANPFFLFEAVAALTGNLQASAGILAVGLTGFYSLAAGVGFTVFLSSFKRVSGAGGLAPGLLVSGCASCGAGVLSLIGLGGALSVLPFSGNLVRAGGIGLILFFLARTGNPEVCEVD